MTSVSLEDAVDTVEYNEEVEKFLNELDEITDYEIYEDFVKSVRTEHHNILWALAGLNAEAGEVAGVIEKKLRKTGTLFNEDGDMLSEIEDKLLDELGDTLFFLVCVAMEAGYSLDDVVEHNINKLAKRRDEGTLYEREEKSVG